jgi:uracil-DNA glycosylase
MPTTRHNVQLEASWQAPLVGELELPYMQALCAFLVAERKAGKQIFPETEDIFNAFSHTPLTAVKVVIIGQDPYHGEGQAHGLCFSVKPGIRIPPSLRNIFREVHADLGVPAPDHGHLTAWAQQGVLLLNSVLSVEGGRAGSHQGQGWERFTDTVIEVINRECEGVVFMLWGNYAQGKGAIIDTARHCVLQAPHPSPLSAHRGFLGCGHFSEANHYLQAQGEAPINWSLPPL